MAQPVRSKQRRTHRRGQLLTSAARLFQEFGYHNVSMDGVATAVGLTGPALYRHFRNKHDVLAQALLEQLSAVDTAARHALAPTVEPAERLDVFHTHLAALVLEREETLLWKRERRHLAGDEQLEFRQRLRDVLAVAVQVLRGTRPDLPGQDAELLGWAILSVYSNVGTYSQGLERGRASELLARMARAVVACELSEVPAPTQPQVRLVERKPAGRRERILQAAVTQFAAYGYYDVSIEDIASAADAAIATVYQHFSSKTELLETVLARGGEGVAYMTTHRLAWARAEEALDVLVRMYVELAVGPHGSLLSILAADLLYLPEEGQQRIRKSQREFVEEWVAALGVVRPKLSLPEARGLAQSAIGMITDISQTPGILARPAITEELRLIATAILHS